MSRLYEEGSKKFRNTDHGLLRWNSRVKNPVFKTKSELNCHLQQLYDEGKVKHLFGDYYLIDDDIIAVLDVLDEQLVGITFFGRRSVNPMLWNLPQLLKSRKKYGKVNLEAFLQTT
ncbi:MAG: hypothetical protein H0Z24_08685 [Thermosipho sp. (in: Bacteria)]|nr:hypothetical protein [Thermosipho sp. (in: thermotogales)]